MGSPSTPSPRPAITLENALSLLRRRRGARALETGSPELDDLMGGLGPGLFHLFYGPEGDGLPDRLLHRLLVEAVKEEWGRAVYLVCGNYRRSRTVMDSGLLLSLIEEAGLDVDDALNRIHVVCAFSERHLIGAPQIIEGILGGADGFRLVAVQQLTKLFYGRHALGREDPAEFTGVVSRLRKICFERDIVLAATGRVSGRGRPIPSPEGGSFLMHAASTIIYLRESRSGPMSAYVVKHPDRGRVGRILHFGEAAPAWAG